MVGLVMEALCVPGSSVGSVVAARCVERGSEEVMKLVDKARIIDVGLVDNEALMYLEDGGCVNVRGAGKEFIVRVLKALGLGDDAVYGVERLLGVFRGLERIRIFTVGSSVVLQLFAPCSSIPEAICLALDSAAEYVSWLVVRDEYREYRTEKVMDIASYILAKVGYIYAVKPFVEKFGYGLLLRGINMLFEETRTVLNIDAVQNIIEAIAIEYRNDVMNKDGEPVPVHKRVLKLYTPTHVVEVETVIEPKHDLTQLVELYTLAKHLTSRIQTTTIDASPRGEVATIVSSARVEALRRELEAELRNEQIEQIEQTLQKMQEIVMHYTWTNIRIEKR